MDAELGEVHGRVVTVLGACSLVYRGVGLNIKRSGVWFTTSLVICKVIWYGRTWHRMSLLTPGVINQHKAQTQSRNPAMYFWHCFRWSIMSLRWIWAWNTLQLHPMYHRFCQSILRSPQSHMYPQPSHTKVKPQYTGKLYRIQPIQLPLLLLHLRY